MTPAIINEEDAIHILKQLLDEPNQTIIKRKLRLLIQKLETQLQNFPVSPKPAYRSQNPELLELKTWFIAICQATSWEDLSAYGSKKTIEDKIYEIGKSALLNKADLSGRHKTAYEKDPALFKCGKALIYQFFKSPERDHLASNFSFVRLILEKAEY